MFQPRFVLQFLKAETSKRSFVNDKTGNAESYDVTMVDGFVGDDIVRVRVYVGPHGLQPLPRGTEINCLLRGYFVENNMAVVTVDAANCDVGGLPWNAPAPVPVGTAPGPVAFAPSAAPEALQPKPPAGKSGAK